MKWYKRRDGMGSQTVESRDNDGGSRADGRGLDRQLGWVGVG